MNKYDLLIIGHLSRDEIILHGKPRKTLGGSLYWLAFPANSSGLNVAVAVKIARGDRFMLKEFEKEGIKTYPIDTWATKERMFIYPLPNNLDKRIIRVLVNSAPIISPDLPEVEAKVTILAGVQNGDFSSNFVKSIVAVKQYGDLALDAQSFTREVRDREIFYKQWRERKQILSLCKYFHCDKKEAEILTDEDPEKAVVKLADWGAKEIIITSKDGIMTYVEGKYYNEILSEKNIKGRTGRGDTAFASYIVGRLRGMNCYEATRLAKEQTEIKLRQKGAVK